MYSALIAVTTEDVRTSTPSRRGDRSAFVERSGGHPGSRGSSPSRRRILASAEWIARNSF